MRKDIPAAGSALCSTELPMGRMFDRIASTYDFANHLLSLGRDFSWRRKAAKQIGGDGPLKVADLATGTGDLLISVLQEGPRIDAVGLDVSGNMLRICRRKLRRRRLAERVELLCGDAAATPFPAGAFDAVTIGFGIRNTADPARTLSEMHRILKPGGIALVLEFSLPRQRIVRWSYLKYLRHVVPLVGRWVSGDPRAYRYLDTSIESFYQAGDFVALMRQAGFCQVAVIPLTFGVAAIYRGVKSPISGET